MKNITGMLEDGRAFRIITSKYSVGQYVRFCSGNGYGHYLSDRGYKIVDIVCKDCGKFIYHLEDDSRNIISILEEQIIDWGERF